MTLKEYPLAGWRLERVEHIRRLGHPFVWLVALMRDTTGEIVGETREHLDDAADAAIEAALRRENGDTI